MQPNLQKKSYNYLKADLNKKKIDVLRCKQ